MSARNRQATAADAAEFGLKPDEWQRILDRVGNTLSITELGIFSVMWSEHCSYKSSKLHLKTLPTTGARVICGPGETARGQATHVAVLGDARL